ncbi:MAG TPA: DUF3667 domain-containing protein [Rhodanobacteraceae bacterium]|nr:DUF3667 domain-containing protein [Rhodanobacteraceae bacterium]
MDNENAPTSSVATSGKTPCANCGAPMFGPYCYACGQPQKGMIRHLASVMSDVLDTVFNIDSRIVHTLLPLYFRPGFLTLEYFAGRRVRYVTPFRLFFFLSLISFFAIQYSLDLGHDTTNIYGPDGSLFSAGRDDKAIDQARTPAEVQQRLDAAVAGFETARKAPGMPDLVSKRLADAEQALHAQADARLAWLKKQQDARARGEPTQPAATDELDFPRFNGKPWDINKNPLHIDWLPAAGNATLNDLVKHMQDNLAAAKHDPGRAIAGLFSVLPQTLVVLMPLFAVLLKILYIFKRRLYMEHLMVALHSHAFIFLSLLLLCLLSWIRAWAATHATWLSSPLALLGAAVWIWLPIYLFLMQKRVYRQGWIMTFMKYCVVGFCYLVMIGFGLAGAVIASLAFA